LSPRWYSNFVVVSRNDNNITTEYWLQLYILLFVFFLVAPRMWRHWTHRDCASGRQLRSHSERWAERDCWSRLTACRWWRVEPPRVRLITGYWVVGSRHSVVESLIKFQRSTGSCVWAYGVRACVRAFVCYYCFPLHRCHGKEKKWCSCVVGLRATRGAVAVKRNAFPRSSAAGSRFCSLVRVDLLPSRGSVLLPVWLCVRVELLRSPPQPVGGWCDGRSLSSERAVVGAAAARGRRPCCRRSPGRQSKWPSIIR